MLKDLLAAGRVSNLPTVWTNVVVGAAIGLSLQFGEESSSLGLSFILAILAGSFLYVAGCFYNDYHDREWDAEYKPERAIPSGRLKASTLAKYTLAFTLIGVSLCGIIGMSGLAVAAWIVIFVFIYTRIHKKTALGIVPMGLCRAGLYFLGFVSVCELDGKMGLQEYLQVIIPAVGLMSYIAGITLVARTEASGRASPEVALLGMVLLFVPVFTHFIQGEIGISSPLYFVGGALLLVFLKEKVGQSVGKFVSICLAGICVIDGMLLWNLVPRAFGDMSMYVAMSVMVLGFLLSVLMQKIAPAT